MLDFHESVKIILHAQVECDDEGEKEYLHGVLDQHRDVGFVPLEFLEEVHERAPSRKKALLYILEGDLLFFRFLHYFLPRCGGTVMVTPLGAKRKMFFVTCCMEPLSA